MGSLSFQHLPCLWNQQIKTANTIPQTLPELVTYKLESKYYQL